MMAFTRRNYCQRAPDAVIARWAADAGFAVISKDEDFLRFAGDPPFVWLRCGNGPNRVLFAWLEQRWPEVERRLGAGELVVELR